MIKNKHLFDLSATIGQKYFLVALVLFQVLGAVVSGTTEFFMFRKYFMSGIPDIIIQNLVTGIFTAVWEFGIFAVNAPIVAIIERYINIDQTEKNYAEKTKSYTIALRVLGVFFGILWGVSLMFSMLGLNQMVYEFTEKPQSTSVAEQNALIAEKDKLIAELSKSVSTTAADNTALNKQIDEIVKSKDSYYTTDSGVKKLKLQKEKQIAALNTQIEENNKIASLNAENASRTAKANEEKVKQLQKEKEALIKSFQAENINNQDQYSDAILWQKAIGSIGVLIFSIVVLFANSILSFLYLFNPKNEPVEKGEQDLFEQNFYHFVNEVKASRGGKYVESEVIRLMKAALPTQRNIDRRVAALALHNNLK